MTGSAQSTDMAEFQKVLASSKHIIAVAGAGLSAASGIPTFRGAGGLWRTHDAMQLATPQAFRENPSRVWQFYHYRRETALKANPNAAHLALAQFSLPSVRARVAPDADFTLITQNVDGLSTRAMDTVLSSSQATSPDPEVDRMLEMHGRLFEVACTRTRACGHTELDFSSPVASSLAGTENLDGKEVRIEEKDLPKCKKCGGLARPGVVWFGEMPRYLGEIGKLVKEADLCLVVGTSSTVYPAAGYAAEVQDHGGKVAVFNLDRSQGDEEADFLFLGGCEQTLPQALGLAEATTEKGT
ncbi:NAD-dependent protein deacylase [Peniophora sp. CONT]|nr:NAD-dependent protein deacylase [Peniophora sp. CONT]